MPERIGPYRVLTRIATGGMAELFTAKQVGLEGFEKVVAVKRILNHLVDDRDFVQMFLDEARLVAQLNHPNIVQIYDLGRDEETYFIAMEYVHGRDLASIGKRAVSRGRPIPPPYLAQVLADACQGLHHAHCHTSAEGVPMRIVHRDVTPQNILVAFSGGVKLVDFGIAKAATKAAHTRAGVLKGKYGYMSPEQVQGQGVDARSDVFALGVVLYEMLAGVRPFDGENSMQTLKAVVQDDPPPLRERVPDVPPALEQVVDQALQKSPDRRYQTAQQLQLDLEDYIQSTSERTNSVALSRWLSELFNDALGDGGSRTELSGVVGQLGDTADLRPSERAGDLDSRDRTRAGEKIHDQATRMSALPVGDDPWDDASTHFEGPSEDPWDDATVAEPGLEDEPAVFGHGPSSGLSIEVDPRIQISDEDDPRDPAFDDETRVPQGDSVDDPTIARPGLALDDDDDATIGHPGLNALIGPEEDESLAPIQAKSGAGPHPFARNEAAPSDPPRGAGSPLDATWAGMDAWGVAFGDEESSGPTADARTRAGGEPLASPVAGIRGDAPTPEQPQAARDLADSATWDGDGLEGPEPESALGTTEEPSLSSTAELDSEAAARALAAISLERKEFRREPTANPSRDEPPELDLGLDDDALESDPLGRPEFREYNQALISPQPPPSLGAPPRPDGAAGAMGIGSTNVPPAALSMEQVLSSPLDGSSPTASPSPPARARVTLGRRKIRERVRQEPEPASPSGAEPLLPAPEGPDPGVEPWELDDGRTGPLPGTPSRAPAIPPGGSARNRSARGSLAVALAVLAGVLVVFAARELWFRPAYVTIRTQPPGARVFVNGTAQPGETPLTLRGLQPNESYRVRLEREGFVPEEQTIRLAPGRPAIWKTRLEPLDGP
jgi:serine/threonine protein kinase